MNWTEEKIEQAMEQIAEKAAVDKAFRELCLSNPNEAIKAATGEDVPAQFKIRFVENSGAHATYVLPDLVQEGDQLSDADLDSVAGGYLTTKS